MGDDRRIREVDVDTRAEGAAPCVEQMLDAMLGSHQVLESVPNIISVKDRDHRILYMNHLIPGYQLSDVVGTNALTHVAPEDRERYQGVYERAWTSGDSQTLTFKTVGEQYLETTFVPLKQGSRVVFMLGSNIDITDRRHAESALRESERRLRHAATASGMGTWELRRGQLTWDDALCQIYGIRPEDAPRRIPEFLAMVHPEDREVVSRIVARHRETGVYDDFEHRLVRPNGEVRQVISRGTPIHDDEGLVIGFLGGVFDITARKRLEAQLHQAQKMEAVGQLTAGVAHNFNNALSVIIHNAALCRDGADAQTGAQLAEIEYAAQRAAEMVRQLMIFARADSHARKAPMDLVRSVRRTIEMCRRTMDPRISLELTTAAEIPSIEGNTGQIEQVLLNICLNARDALESARTPKPRIAIHIEPARPDEVRIRITDNGPGIPEEIRTRVFEPFFTTKEVGRGTGLGLAMAYSIIADHRGRIDCETLPGQGAQFEIVLPISAVEYLEDTDSGGVVRGGSETVLLIDDDTSVRRALREILSRSGYSVLEAGDGESGVALFEREQLRVDLVVLDRSMPRLSGDGVLERIEALDTGIPVILLSGHPGSAGGGGRSAAVLSKPTDRTTLLRTVREVLDRPL
jgi:PAS domain S-box-containing protein